MNLFKNKGKSQKEWSFDEWSNLELRLRGDAGKINSEKILWRRLTVEARKVMRNYTTSFFIVSRFLPVAKRLQVEAVYAAVRYPDEIADTFPLEAAEKRLLLEKWRRAYEIGLQTESLREAIDMEVPCFLAAFTKVVRDNRIPADYYHSFLDAMCSDTNPRRFVSLNDLIENYIYGSAVVVGYFLTYIYGAKNEADFERAMKAARELGIALQMTNFMRDVREDQRRGRIYLPLDMLGEENIQQMDAEDENQHEAISRVIRRLAGIAETFYSEAQKNLDAFAPDCRPAIDACIKVYRRLNAQIISSNQTLIQREQVPLKEKFEVLPLSKYWRIPYAYLIQ